MLAVGLVAIVLAVERFFFDRAVQIVKSDDEYLLGEAVLVWLLLSFFIIGIPAAIIWDMVRHRDYPVACLPQTRLSARGHGG